MAALKARKAAVAGAPSQQAFRPSANPTLARPGCALFRLCSLPCLPSPWLPPAVGAATGPEGVTRVECGGGAGAGTALRVDDDDEPAQEDAPPLGTHAQHAGGSEGGQSEESEERELEARPGTSQAIRASAANKLNRLRQVPSRPSRAPPAPLPPPAPRLPRPRPLKTRDMREEV